MSNNVNDNQKWKQLADELHFEYIDDYKQVFADKDMLRYFAPDANDANIKMMDKMLTNPMFDLMAKKIFRCMLQGTHKEKKFYIFPSISNYSSGSKQSSQYFFNIVTPYSKNLSFRFSICESNIVVNLFRMIFSNFYFKIEQNERLDKKLLIRTKDKDKMKLLLSSSNNILKLENLYNNSNNYKINEVGTIIRIPGEIPAIDKIKSTLDVMSNNVIIY